MRQSPHPARRLGPSAQAGTPEPSSGCALEVLANRTMWKRFHFIGCAVRGGIRDDDRCPARTHRRDQPRRHPALRRRFGFVELMPDTTILKDQTVGSIPLGPYLSCRMTKIQAYCIWRVNKYDSQAADVVIRQVKTVEWNGFGPGLCRYSHF